MKRKASLNAQVKPSYGWATAAEDHIMIYEAIVAKGLPKQDRLKFGINSMNPCTQNAFC